MDLAPTSEITQRHGHARVGRAGSLHIGDNEGIPFRPYLRPHVITNKVSKTLSGGFFTCPSEYRRITALVIENRTVCSLAGGGDLGEVDLIYLPEPMSAVLFSLAIAIGLVRFRRSGG